MKTSLIGKLLLFVVSSLGALPLPWRRFLGKLGGTFFFLFPTRERQVAKLQLEMVFGKEQARILLPRVFSQIGLTISESINIGAILTNPKLKIIANGWEIAEQLYQDKGGVLALTAHFGNWDLLAGYSVSRGIAIHTIGRPARFPPLQEVLSKLRDDLGVVTLWRDDRQALKKVLRLWKGGQVVAALIDQDTYVESAMVPFLGPPARTPRSLVDLAKRTKVKIVSAFAVRNVGGFEILIREIDDEQSSEEILLQFHSHLEQLVQRYPEQWVWFHKRWRTLPSGERLGTKAYLQYLREQLCQVS